MNEEDATQTKCIEMNQIIEENQDNVVETNSNTIKVAEQDSDAQHTEEETIVTSLESKESPIDTKVNIEEATISNEPKETIESAIDEVIPASVTTSDVSEVAKDSEEGYDPKDVHYEGELAIYTDPKTGDQFQWDNDKNEWVARSNMIYGFEDDTHTYTDSDGVKLFWDKERKAWFPKIDDDFMAKYQMNYGFIDNTTKETPKPPEPKPEPPPKQDKGIKRKPSEPTWFQQDDNKNTKVYVSNLPLDITEEEFAELMQKCGIIMREPSSGKLKIKMYTQPNTTDLKGDALCTYIRIESVELALKLIDGYELRNKKIKCERASFEMKGQYDPKLKPKTKKRKDKDKLKKMQEKLFDWRPEKQRGERAKHERIVIVRNLFESKMFDEDVSLILEFQDDLREECSKCGEVRKVTIFDRHPEGIAQINMTEPEQADACVLLLNGRWFGKRQLSAEIWDGKTKFKIAETDSQITQRLGNWDKFLEGEESKEVKKDVVEVDVK